MPGTETQHQTPAPVTREFDEQGQTIEATESDEVGSADLAEAEVAGRYQIGDKFFATLDEAHAYATEQLYGSQTEDHITDAYRQGILDASRQTSESNRVTQPASAPVDDFDEEEYYANPKAFMTKYANKIKTETQAELEQRQALQAQSDQVWREFTERHPALADYRQETEGYVAQNIDTVKRLFASKGKAVGYDYIALELKKQFSRYAQALKPSRSLANTKTQSPQASQSPDVTQQKPVKKPMTMAEQIRSIRKRR
jgi:hypothetical protein